MAPSSGASGRLREPGPPGGGEVTAPWVPQASASFAGRCSARLHLNFPEPLGVGGGADPPRKPPGGRLLPATRGPAPQPRQRAPSRGSRRAGPAATPRRQRPSLHHAPLRAPSERLPEGLSLNLRARLLSRQSAPPASHWPAAVTWGSARARPGGDCLARAAPPPPPPPPRAARPPLRPAWEETKCCGRETSAAAAAAARGPKSALPVTPAPCLP